MYGIRLRISSIKDDMRNCASKFIIFLVLFPTDIPADRPGVRVADGQDVVQQRRRLLPPVRHPSRLHPSRHRVRGRGDPPEFVTVASPLPPYGASLPLPHRNQHVSTRVILVIFVIL